MLDEALPRFTISSQPTSNDPLKTSIYLSRPHSDPEPSYTLALADPSSPASRNCYAAGLLDAYNPEVLFGEVLISPKWTQPSLSAEEMRRNGGIPPPPEPLMPSEFTIQLYNPEQQVQVRHKAAQILGSTRFEFSLPIDTFRQPSASLLDKGANDPAADATVPQINFAWKKENKLTKELTCYMTGKSTDITTKKKSKEPDIALAHLKGLKDMTIYEPNLYRVELEDPKGLEVVLLLSAAIIRDVFSGKDPRTIFNVSQAGARRDSGGSVHSLASPDNAVSGPLSNAPAAVAGLYSTPARTHAHSSPPPPPLPARHGPHSNAGQPVTDPRTQWEIDNETARLRAAAEAEERARRKGEERARRERERADEEETRRLRKMVEREEKERRERQKEIDRETERLKKVYGTSGHTTQGGPMMSGANGSRPQTNSAPTQQAPFRPSPQAQGQQAHQGQQTQSWYGYPPGVQHQQPYPQAQQSFVPNPGYQQHFNSYQPQPHPNGPYLQPFNTGANTSSQSLNSNAGYSSGGRQRRSNVRGLPENESLKTKRSSLV